MTKAKRWTKPLRRGLPVLLGVLLLLGLLLPTSASAAEDGIVRTADGSSFNSWRNYLTNENDQYSTENIGRIWTDKTVTGDDFTFDQGDLTGETIEKGTSDFLVALSALSSTSNLSAQVNVPLDIVLVLDVSGSMRENLNSYQAVYELNTSRTYYIQSGNSYRSVRYYQNWGWYDQNNNSVTPMTSADDTTSGHVQFYSQSSTTKLAALKTAVNGFIDATAEMNAGITDSSKQHRISLITYASGTNTLYDLTTCTSENVAQMKADVDDLSANGATWAHSGLNTANTQLTRNGREDAQQVVIFFTDGEPNQGTGFWPNVAAQAVNHARTMKSNGALVYSIGVFSGANPESTPGTTVTGSDFNAYMHCVSSNYPSASATSNGSGTNSTWRLTPGTRAADSNYYKAATNADELNAIFEEIATEVEEASVGVPTHTSGGFHNSGYITFTDQLGDYMKVDDFKSIVYNDRIFSNPTVTENDDNTTTYTFNAPVDPNSVADGDSVDHNLNHILITVDKGADAKTGDTVTVQIPASLIPLRSFDVEESETGRYTMQVSEAYPIRVFFGVSVKDGILEDVVAQDGTITYAAIDNPDADLQEYIEDNTDANGQLKFYSNKWSGEADGDTTAVFTPARTNSFYYFGANTPVYTDEACTNPADEDDVNNAVATDRFYYKRVVYTAGSGATSGAVEATATDVVYSFPASNFQVGAGSGNYGFDSSGHLYIYPATHRLSSINAMKTVKDDNNTDTASTIINPTWINAEDGEGISVALGNNGVLSAELPGSLTVSKTVSVADGLELSDYTDKKFSFTVELKNGTTPIATTSFEAEVKDADGDVVDSTPLTTDESGQANFTLTHGQTLYLYGLPAGATYTVSETAEAGFTTTFTGDTGTIQAGQASAAAFTNAYSADPVSLSGVQVRKDFNLWEEGSSFTFRMSSSTATDPLPGGVTGYALLTISNTGADAIKGNGSKTAAFADIEFTKPGTYTYSIWEVTPAQADRVPGVSYSNVAYALVVEVTDDGEGNLVINKDEGVKLYKLTDDQGKELTDAEIEDAGPVDDGVAAFTNTFDANSEKADILATKIYTDESGAKDLQNNDFKFRLTAVTAGAPMPERVQTESDGTRYSETGNINDSIAFAIEYETAHATHSYTYQLTEVIPDGATQNADGTYTLNGVTYDPTEYYAVVAVAVEDGILVPTVTYYKDSVSDGNVVQDVTFSNTYEPTQLETTIQVEKILTGRDMAENETFSFTITGGDATTTAAMGDGTITFEKTTASVSGGDKGETMVASFGKITFTKPGIYTFNVTETPGTAPGMTYDSHTAVVTVTVVDNNGKLELAETDGITYNNHGANDSTTAAQFNNRYTATGSYKDGDGLTIDKVLTGRAMERNEFSYTVTGDKEETGSWGAAAAGATRSASILRNLTFTQDDVGQTFTYYVSEDTSDALPGVTYDQSQYKIEIFVADNGDGTLDVTDTITRVRNAQGEEVNESADSITFNNSYKPDPVTVDTGTLAPLPLHKVLTGRDWLETDSFEFTITNTQTPDGVTAPMPAETTVTVKAPEGTAADTPLDIDFGKITFDQAGTYVYQVRETDGGKTINGVAYDNHVATITVVVSDNTETGKLEAVVSVTGETFTNRYETDPANLRTQATLRVSKTLTGRDWGESESFEFVLLDGEEELDSLELTKTAQSGEFDDITYTAAGTYVYTVKEIRPDTGTNGLEYSTEEYTVTVVVTEDKAEGTLAVTEVTVTDGSGNSVNPADHIYTLPFENAYYAPTKSVADKDGNNKNNGTAQVGEELTYTISYRNTEAAAATITITDVIPAGTELVDGKITDGGSYDEGTITWTIENVAPKAEGTVSFTVRVTTDALDKTIANQATVQIGENDPSSTNTTVTKVESGSLTISKTVELAGDQGTEVNAKQEFTFNVTLQDAGNQPLTGAYEGLTQTGEAGVYTLTLVHGDSVTIENLPKGTSYVVTETDIPAGYQPEQKSFTGVIGEDSNRADFVNVYKVAPLTAPLTLDATKHLTVLGDENVVNLSNYSFTINAYSDASCTTLVGSGKSNENGKVEIAIATGTGAYAVNKAGEYEFYLREEIPSGAEGNVLGGIRYDGTVYKAVVTVVDHGDGTLEQDTAQTVYTYADGSAANDGAVFRNTYEASGVSLNLNANKVLTGRNTPMEANEFSFALYDEGGNVVARGQNDANGSVSFSTINFGITDEQYQQLLILAAGGDAAEAEAPETDPAVEGEIPELTDPAAEGETPAAPDSSAEDGTPAAPDSSVEGEAPAEEQPAEEPETPVVTEPSGETGTTADPESPAEPEAPAGEEPAEAAAVTKVTGAAQQQEQKTAAAPTDESAEPAAEAEDAAEAALIAAQANEEIASILGEHVYTMRETSVDGNGVTTDKSVYQVTVTISDNGSGSLVAAVTKVVQLTDANGNQTGVDMTNAFAADANGNPIITFTNRYTASPVTLSGDAAVTVTKLLNGRNINDGEFAFRLAPVGTVAGDPVPAAGLTASVTGDGTANVASAAFGDLTYTQPGTYQYVVTENDTGKGGVIYDDAAYYLTVTVTDNNKGQLTAETAITEGSAQGTDAGALVFVNSYTTESVSVTLEGTKNLTGGTLTEGQFSFRLESGSYVRLATNAADGSITFGPITFTAAGEYVFTVSEVAGTEPGMTYDSTVYTVKVVVTDDGQGKLSAQVTYPENGISFSNVLTAAPTDPGTPAGPSNTPKTGDSAPLVLVAVVLVAACAALVTLLLVHRRRNRR